MTRDEFLGLVDAWGGDISRWPQDRQHVAMQFAMTDTGAAILQEAQRFDGLFSTQPMIGPDRPGEATFAVMQRVAAQRDVRWRDWVPSWWVPASFACSALIGVWIAVAIPPSSFHENPEATIDLVLDGGVTSFWSAQ